MNKYPPAEPSYYSLLEATRQVYEINGKWSYNDLLKLVYNASEFKQRIILEYLMEGIK